ncbi:MAG: hypothetical protein JST26_14065 [Bacteroidetes bacterium]|nr:hypothetical protein [Bacteroidota bacterium]
MKSILFISGVCVLLLSSCYKDKYEELYPAIGLSTASCDTTAVPSFSTDIMPILNTSCGTTDNSCHSASATSGTNLTTWAGVKISAHNGSLVGDITFDPSYNPMPKGASTKIDNCSINKIIKWVNSGYPNN